VLFVILALSAPDDKPYMVNKALIISSLWSYSICSIRPVWISTIMHYHRHPTGISSGPFIIYYLFTAKWNHF